MHDGTHTHDEESNVACSARAHRQELPVFVVRAKKNDCTNTANNKSTELSHVEQRAFAGKLCKAVGGHVLLRCLRFVRLQRRGTFSFLFGCHYQGVQKELNSGVARHDFTVLPSNVEQTNADNQADNTLRINSQFRAGEYMKCRGGR